MPTKRARTWTCPLEDEGFDESCVLIRSLEDNRQRARARRRALDWLPRGRAYAGRRIILDALLERINWDTGLAYPGFAQIARDTGYSRSYVIECMNWLREHGYVARRPRWSLKRDQRSNEYTVPAMVGEPLRRRRGSTVHRTTECGPEDYGSTPERTTGESCAPDPEPHQHEPHHLDLVAANHPTATQIELQASTQLREKIAGQGRSRFSRGRRLLV